MINFLLDQGLPRSTVDELSSRGFNSEHVGRMGMATASDEEILITACERNAIVVTLDADFHSLLASSNAKKPTVIRIRIEGLKSKDVADIIEQVVERAESEIKAGAAISVTISGIRIRLLPLV